MVERRVTDGGRDLRVYLDRIGVSVPTFCERHRLDRIQVQRVMNGERWQRISVDLAFSIEKATAGAVKASRFKSASAKTATPKKAA